MADKRTLAVATVCAMAFPATAQAGWRLHLDALGVMPVAGWQTRAFGPGGGVAGGLEYSLGQRFGLEVNAGYLALSASDGALDQGVARPSGGSLGYVAAGFRLRPFGRAGARGQAEGLWLEALGGVGPTGTDLRPVVFGRVGVGFALGSVSLGPWVGFAQVIQTDSEAIQGDARLALAGVEVSLFDLAAPIRREPPRQVAPPPLRCPPPAVHVLPDGDGDGCPDDDTDNDRVADRVDRCPALAEDRDDFQDADGCPDPDNDSDGILDGADLCPDDPEVINGVDDGDGCPDEAQVRVSAGRILLSEQIHFRTDSSTIEPSSWGIVEAVARVMRQHPEYRTLRIEGHADDVGTDRYNFNLSLRRASAVADRLHALGVEAGRVEFRGYGRRVPRVAGSDSTAREANRRVEFIVDGRQASGVALGPDGWVEVTEAGERSVSEAP